MERETLIVKKQVQKALLDLTKKNGGVLLAEKVFEAARPKNSPLHEYFEWNQEKAWLEWNLERARDLIQSFRIAYREVEPDTKNYRVETTEDAPGLTPHPQL